MRALNLKAVEKYVNENIDTFHNSRLEKVSGLKLKDVLKRKNPYLFRAKNILTAEKLVESLLDAFLSSSEEELFGEFLEGLAIFVSSQTTGGRKSSSTGIDLEFDNSGTRYVVSIKSGQNWGNSSQYKALEASFVNAIRILKQSGSVKNIQAVLGMCYGRRKRKDTGKYLKVTGQDFWYFISENKNLYTDIVEPIGYRAKEHNDHYMHERAALINIFTKELLDEFCVGGRIDWAKVVKFNSGNLERF